MYHVHVGFTDGSEPFDRFGLTRDQYGEVMRGIGERYRITVDETDILKSGDVLIIASAHEKEIVSKESEEMRRLKSRARHYSKSK